MHLKHAKKFTTAIEKGLVKTGSDVSYYPKDDGDYQKGVPTEGSRFLDNGDGTVTDKVTGLMWVKDPSQIPGGVFGSPGSPIGMTWYDAIDACENLDYAGYNDWRLPNIKELFSMVNFGQMMPAMFDEFFPGLAYYMYWSSTTSMGWYEYAWAIDFYIGYVWDDWKDGDWCYVWPVRGGKP